MRGTAELVCAAIFATAFGLESSETSETVALADVILDNGATNEVAEQGTWWRVQAFLLAASHVMLFAVANWFFAKLLYRDYEAGCENWQSTKVQLVGLGAFFRW